MKCFDALLNVLNSSATTFNKQTDDVSRTEVDAKIAQISDINESIQQKQKEIADLQQQVKSMQSQTEVSRAKLQEAKSNFAAALERRRAEIQQQHKEFETILGTNLLCSQVWSSKPKFSGQASLRLAGRLGAFPTGTNELTIL